MSKKYIKGKDGKFKGSLPDPASLPTPISGKTIPAHPSNRLTPSEDSTLSQLSRITIREASPSEEVSSVVKINKKIYPGDIRAYYQVEGQKDLSGSVFPNNNGTFTSTIDATAYGEATELSAVIHGSAEEAENRVRKDLDRLGGYLAAFDAVNSSESASKVVESIDNAISDDPNWQGAVDETFGPKTSWMRSSRTNRGATVQRYKTGYYVRINEYETAWDKEGKLLLVKAYPDFDTAHFFAGFVVSGVADN